MAVDARVTFEAPTVTLTRTKVRAEKKIFGLHASSVVRRPCLPSWRGVRFLLLAFGGGMHNGRGSAGFVRWIIMRIELDGSLYIMIMKYFKTMCRTVPNRKLRACLAGYDV